MARPAKQSRGVLIEKLSGVFRAFGYDGASMSALSDASGLSKASLYHHFPGGKEDMANRVLGAEGKRLQHFVLSSFDGTLAPKVSLLNSVEAIAEFYEGTPPSCLMNSMLHGSGAQLFGRDIAAAVTIWQQRYSEAYTTICADKSEGTAWGEYAVERIQGALILCRVQNSRQPLLSCLSELRGDVEAAEAS